MKGKDTQFGHLAVLSQEQLFRRLADAVNEAAGKADGECTVALTGGSAPRIWYPWVVGNGALGDTARERVLWTVSDERHVPPASDESNFGTAERLLLDPLSIPQQRRLPWPVELPAADAAAGYAERLAGRRGDGTVYDLCILGMGDDCHTASLFPGSPLLGDDRGEPFAAVEVPGRGWRLTLTPAGLGRCARIVVIVAGAGKAAALQAVFGSPPDPLRRPVQVLREVAGRVTWLVDTDAARLLA